MDLDALIPLVSKALYEAQARPTRSRISLCQAYESDARAVLDALREVGALRERVSTL